MQDQFCNAYGKEFCQTKGVCNWIKHQLTIKNMIGSQSNKWIFFLKLRRLMGHQVTTHYHQRSLPPQTLPNNQLEMEPTAFFHGTSDIGSSHPASLIACANWFCQSEVKKWRGAKPCCSTHFAPAVVFTTNQTKKNSSQSHYQTWFYLRLVYFILLTRTRSSRVISARTINNEKPQGPMNLKIGRKNMKRSYIWSVDFSWRLKRLQCQCKANAGWFLNQKPGPGPLW